MKKYDYLIVGAGLFGAVFAYEAMKRGKTCLVIERRDHIAGNIYCETIEDIHVHKYGAHIFIPPIRKFGTISTSSQNSTTISTLRLPSIRTNCTTCRST